MVVVVVVVVLVVVVVVVVVLRVDVGFVVPFFVVVVVVFSDDCDCKALVLFIAEPGVVLPFVYTVVCSGVCEFVLPLMVVVITASGDTNAPLPVVPLCKVVGDETANVVSPLFSLHTEEVGVVAAGKAGRSR